MMTFATKLLLLGILAIVNFAIDGIVGSEEQDDELVLREALFLVELLKSDFAKILRDNGARSSVTPSSAEDANSTCGLRSDDMNSTVAVNEMEVTVSAMSLTSVATSIASALSPAIPPGALGALGVTAAPGVARALGQPGPPEALGQPGVPGALGQPGVPGALGQPEVQGAPRTQGALGLPGVPGAQGALGLPGVQEALRAPGAAVALAAPGTAGLLVAPGVAGALGAPGASGALVAPGASGALVAPGASGVLGALGAPGALVAPGAPGALGPPGAAVALGPPGAPRALGAPGASGVLGALGAPGALAAPGAPGALGPPGAVGALGAPGAAGALGAPGVPGALGPPGAAGALVAPGALGALVAPGETGALGAPGAAGAPVVPYASWLPMPMAGYSMPPLGPGQQANFPDENYRFPYRFNRRRMMPDYYYFEPARFPGPYRRTQNNIEPHTDVGTVSASSHVQFISDTPSTSEATTLSVASNNVITATALPSPTNLPIVQQSPSTSQFSPLNARRSMHRKTKQIKRKWKKKHSAKPHKLAPVAEPQNQTVRPRTHNKGSSHAQTIADTPSTSEATTFSVASNNFMTATALPSPTNLPTVQQSPSTSQSSPINARRSMHRKTKQIKRKWKNSTKPYELAPVAELQNKTARPRTQNKDGINSVSTSKPMNTGERHLRKQQCLEDKNESEDVEISQVASELIKEVNGPETENISIVNIFSHTKDKESRKKTQTTMKIYLGRSSRLPIPLPENNAFCHFYPNNPLCGTY